MKKVLVFAALVSLAIGFAFSDQTKGVTSQVVTFKGQRVILYEKSFALLIGVSKYKYWPDLENIPDELKHLESALEKQGFIVRECLNPTSKELKETIENFINEYGLKTDNRLLVFFTGHGYTRKKGKKGYIVPSDAVNPKRNEIGFVQKAIEMQQIITWARRIEAKHALFVFDSCFSGTVFKSKTLTIPGYISYLTGKPVRQFLTAGSAGETVPSKSYFTKCFIRGIEGEADDDGDGYITGTELGLYVQKKIIGYKIGQTPQFGKIRDPDLDQGDFVFINQVPTAPKPVDIDVSTLKVEAEKVRKERERRAGWSDWQKKFEQNVEKLKEIEKDPDISTALKKEKWQELLRAYSKNNPYSEKDEQLRTYVKGRIAYLEKKKENPFGEKINRKAKRIYKNDKGYWEADYGDGIVMVYIPPGEFTMGSNDGYDHEKPPHTVYLDGFWMGKTEVNVVQFKFFVDDTEYVTEVEKSGGTEVYVESKWQLKTDANWRKPYFSQDDNYPVVCVSWNDAVAFCKWLSHKTGLRFKLPTEAQWEKAARGTDSRKYSWGDHDPYYNGEYYANYDPGKDEADGFSNTAPVGSFPQGASPYGLLDMVGNVWEWCSDIYESDYYKNSPEKNPTGPKSGTLRVMRGGSWFNFFARYLRCAYRAYGRPSYRSLSVGFRLCQEN